MSDRCFQLKFGRGEISANVKCGLEPKALVPHYPKPLADAPDIIENALASPIGSPRLDEIIRRGDKVVIVASDSTRTTASHVFLPIILEKLSSAGVSDNGIAIVFALGIHRRQSEEERRRLMGGDLYGRIAAVDHDARDPARLVSYGSTSRGTEVVVNNIVAEADKIILTGAVSPHYFAGFGGGRKSIMPGVCSLEANLQSHLLVFNQAPGRGRDPDVRVARLAGNPVHEDMLEAAKMVGPHFVLNTIVGPEKDLIAAFAGDLVAAHETACAYYLENLAVKVGEQADLTIVSCGGYPKDINFIQAHKAIHSAYAVTRPGGWMIVLAECPDGFGYPGFIDWFRFGDTAQFEEALRENYEIYGQTAYATFEKATTVKIALVSSLDPRDVERMRIRACASFEEAYSLATEGLPEDFTTYVIPASSSSLLMTEDEHERALKFLAGDHKRGKRKVL